MTRPVFTYRFARRNHAKATLRYINSQSWRTVWTDSPKGYSRGKTQVRIQHNAQSTPLVSGGNNSSAGSLRRI